MAVCGEEVKISRMSNMVGANGGGVRLKPERDVPSMSGDKSGVDGLQKRPIVPPLKLRIKNSTTSMEICMREKHWHDTIKRLHDVQDLERRRVFGQARSAFQEVPVCHFV